LRPKESINKRFLALRFLSSWSQRAPNCAEKRKPALPSYWSSWP